MIKKTDLRIIRTQKAIKEAFCSLLKEKRYEQITVQDIAEKAVINRNTFYLHYLDKDDLLQKLSSECLKELEESININMPEIFGNNLRLIIDTALKTIEKNFSFYQIMMNNSSIPYFGENFREVLKIKINNALKDIKQSKVYNEKRTGLCIEYILSGVIGVIHFWLQSESNYSIEEICNIIFMVHSENPLEVLLGNAK